MSIKKKYLESKPECKVTFKLDKKAANGYKEVSLVGEFNQWNENSHVMKQLKNGDYSITVNLSKGKAYQFKYLANKSEWINDPTPDRLVANEFAGQNSVVEV